jgi:hypothetical protein
MERGDGPGSPWTPEEPEPAGGWPADPDAVPVVIGAWERLPSGAARPAAAARRAYAASFKGGEGLARARRFAEAWRWLQQSTDGGTGHLDSERVEWLYRAGLLRPVRAPDKRGR